MGKWVFGYGSLIWRPGFDFLSKKPALLRGAHRQLCIYSFTHRGTEDCPGLVFGLDRGGACRGMAFEVDPEQWDKTYAYLHAREQQNGVYRETLRRVALDDGRHVDALVYLADPRHKQYAGRLSHVEQLKLVQQGQGQAGPNIEYVVNTHAHLVELGIQDPSLDALVNALQNC